MHSAIRSMLVLVGLVSAAGFSATCSAQGRVRVESPDGRTQITIGVRDGRVTYAVSSGDNAVIEESSMVVTVDGIEITSGVEFGEPARYEVGETYAWRGVHSRAVNRCKGAKIPVAHGGSGTPYTLEVRAYDAGAGFRYIVPGGRQPRVLDEATELRLPAGSTVWFHDLGGHYEDVFDRKLIEDVEAGEWVAPPLTVRLPEGGGYAAITEAALVNYSGMALQADGERGFAVVLGHKHPISYPFELRYKEDIERVSQPAAISGTITSPWRVVLVGADLNTLVNSDVLHNLCPPADPGLFPDGMDTDWVKPGRAVWRYLDGGDRSLEGMKEFSRMAGELGFEYHVIEGFWSRWSEEEIRELVTESKRHGVGLFFWIHSRELRTPEAREAFFARLNRLGVAGAKIDFFDHEHREVVDLYSELLSAAAKHRILVNFHGSNKPTGESRTWPNELVRESVRGMENSRLRERAKHDATIPFTRLLAGHADYTPVHFGERRADTTWAHQIATAAVFTAPLLTYAAHPKSILENPAVGMVKSIPAAWDETIVLPESEIGEVAVLARRSGERWFLAIVNGPTGRTLDVPLSFLEEGAYRVVTVADVKDDPASVQIDEATATREGALSIQLSDGGGFVARFRKDSAAADAR